MRGLFLLGGSTQRARSLLQLGEREVPVHARARHQPIVARLQGRSLSLRCLEELLDDAVVGSAVNRDRVGFITRAHAITHHFLGVVGD